MAIPGNIPEKKDGTLFTHDIGARKTATDFRNAVKGKNWPEAAKSLKPILSLAILSNASNIMSDGKGGVPLEEAPIVKLLSDPDWKAKDLASLLISERGIQNGALPLGNTLFAMRQNNSVLADNVLAEIKNMDPGLYGELNTTIDQLQILADVRSQSKTGLY